MRRLVLGYISPDRIQLIHGTVTGVTAASDGTRVESVSFRPASAETTDSSSLESIPVVAPERSLPCSLFVDCSGPSAISFKYLPAASPAWGPYPRHHYNADVSYVTALLDIPSPAVRQALARTVPTDDPDYGRWDMMGIIEVVSPTHQTGKELYALQRVDDNKCTSIDAIGLCRHGI